MTGRPDGGLDDHPVVCDTGPLIALAKLDRLALLDALFSGAFIPSAVHRELLAKTGPDATRLSAVLGHSVHVHPQASLLPEVAARSEGRGAGEQEAIALARHLGALLIMDERPGRVAARSAGLRVTGTVGLLLRAKAVQLVPEVGPLLDELRRHGYWLSDGVLATARELAGEPPP